MDLWWKVAGWVRVRFTSADVSRTLRKVTDRGIRLEELEFRSALTAEATVARGQLGELKGVLKSQGIEPEVIRIQGGPNILRKIRKRMGLAVFLMLMAVFSFLISDRILFVQVRGNGSVPTGQILEMAARSGIRIGRIRSEIRSENVKNELLGSIPELGWVGINTSGCVATISVQERQTEPEEEARLPGNIVAIRDAIVDSVTVTGGTPQCVAGQAVREGEVLVSGYTDLGLHTAIVPAEAEVYGISSRRVESILPEITRMRGRETGREQKFSLIFGKLRINLYSDSGILHTSCGKMNQVYMLRLPGGWTLPVGLAVETYTRTELTERPRMDAEAVLGEASARYVRRSMIAGEILSEHSEFLPEDGILRLTTQYECRELIGKWSPGVYLEGDAKDDGENGERGAD